MNKNKFEVDWKFRLKDIIWNVEQIVGKSKIKYLGFTQLYGYDVEVVEADNKPFVFKTDATFNDLLEIMEFINEYLPEKGMKFKFYDTGGDSYGFELIKDKL